MRLLLLLFSLASMLHGGREVDRVRREFGGPDPRNEWPNGEQGNNVQYGNVWKGRLPPTMYCMLPKRSLRWL